MLDQRSTRERKVYDLTRTLSRNKSGVRFSITLLIIHGLDYVHPILYLNCNRIVGQQQIQVDPSNDSIHFLGICNVVEHQLSCVYTEKYVDRVEGSFMKVMSNLVMCS